MVMADVFTVVFSVVAILMAVPAYWLMSRALFPRVAIQSRARFTDTPLRLLPLGLIVGSILVTPALVLVNLPYGPAKVIGVWMLAGSVALALSGAGGLATRIGDSISPEDSAANRTLKGGLALELACLLPVLGWFIIPTLVLIAGFGAATLALVKPLEAGPVRVLAEAA